jgi:hypothetical protein
VVPVFKGKVIIATYVSGLGVKGQGFSWKLRHCCWLGLIGCFLHVFHVEWVAFFSGEVLLLMQAAGYVRSMAKMGDLSGLCERERQSVRSWKRDVKCGA